MNWKPVVFTILVIILYVPLVFMGSNVFFPKYTDNFPYKECYPRVEPINNTNQENINKCLDEQNVKQVQYEKEKRGYDGWKYLAIVLFNLVIVSLILFLNFNNEITYGLFIGATVATFIATLIYFNTRSKLGFLALVLVFVLSIYFITKLANKN